MSDTETCAADGCFAPRKVYPSGRTAVLCAAHESYRVQQSKRRIVVDPETGLEVTAGALANLRFLRKQAAGR